MKKQFEPSLYEIMQVFRLLDNLNVPSQEQSILLRIAMKNMGLREFSNLLLQLSGHSA